MSNFIANTSALWMDYFSQLVIQNTLFLCLVLFLLHYSSSIPARFRYLICAAALVKLILPLFIPLRLLSAQPVSNFIAAYPKKVFSSEPDVLTKLPGVDTISLSMSFNWTEILFILWISGVMVYILLMLIWTIRLSLILRSALPETDVKNNKITENNNIRIFISDRITMPLTPLFFPQRIYVPISWKQLNRVCQNHIIQHELAHIRRYDNWIKLLQLVVQSLYFFHPLVYILNKNMNLYREMACDDASINYYQISHPEYSKFLTEIAEKAIWTPCMYQSVSAFIRQKSELFKRIKYQMEEITMNSLSRKKLLRIALIIFLGIVTFSWYISSAVLQSASVKTVFDQPIVKVTVNEKNEIFIDGNKISSENFKAVMEKRTREIKETVVIELNFNSQVAMQRVFSIQQQLQELDLLRVNYKDKVKKGLNLVLPSSAIADQLNNIDKKNIFELLIKSDGSLTANKLAIEKSEIESYLKESLKKNEHLIVAIYADPDAQFADFLDLLDRVHRAEAKRVVIQSG